MTAVSPRFLLFLSAVVAGAMAGWSVRGWRCDAAKLAAEQVARAAEQKQAARVANLTLEWEERQRENDVARERLDKEIGLYRRRASGSCPVPDGWRLLHDQAAVSYDRPSPGDGAAGSGSLVPLVRRQQGF